MEKITKATYKRPLFPNGDKFTMVPARVGHLNEVIDSVNNLDKEYYVTGYFTKNGLATSLLATVKDHNLPITNLQFSLSVQVIGGNYYVFLGRSTTFSVGTACETADGPITITGIKMNSFNLFPTIELIDRAVTENKQVIEFVSTADYTGFNFNSTTPSLGTFKLRALSNGSTWGYADLPAASGFQDQIRFEIRFSTLNYTQQ
jgi:hypothetical protein